MGSKSETRTLVPLRQRHDGLTPEKQATFLERLEGTGSVTEACRAVGLSTTSAYRAYRRSPEFAMYWNRALDARKPMLEDAAFERAVHGSLQPLTRLGKVIGQRRRYSDSLLRYLLERQDRREARMEAPSGRPAGKVVNGRVVEVATREETNAAILKKLTAMERQQEAEKKTELLAWAGRMEQAGLAP